MLYDSHHAPGDLAAGMHVVAGHFQWCLRGASSLPSLE